MGPREIVIDPHLVLSTRPRPHGGGGGDPGLKGEQRVEQRPGLGVLAGDVGVGVLAEHLGVLGGRQLADVLPVGGLGAVAGDVIGGEGGESGTQRQRTSVSFFCIYTTS